MRKLLLASSAALLMVGGAQAADYEAPAAFDWSGFYIGLQGGYGWGDYEVDEIDNDIGDVNITLTSDVEGFVGGIHAGYNFQTDMLLFGIEADGEYSDIDGEQDFNNPNLTSKDIDWLASLRLRAGLPIDRLLLYATGGLALGVIDMETTEDDPPTVEISDEDVAFGYTVGGGIEYAFSDALSARIEYRYTDLENTEVSGEIFGGDFTYEHENTFHAVRGGISWHFGSM